MDSYSRSAHVWIVVAGGRLQSVQTTSQQAHRMPTYTCFTAPESLTDGGAKEGTRGLADYPAYLDEFGLARYMTQVVFNKVAKDDRIGGKPARPDLVWIRCDVREGRSVEMKARLLRRIQQGVAKIRQRP